MIGPGNNEINKIDNAETDGLLGVEDSLSYRINEVERHLHNREKWFGIAAAASGETHVADRMVGITAPFVMTAGNNDFGNWVQVLGSSDTPVDSSSLKFDGHRVIVTDTNSTDPFIVQLAEGESANLAQKILDEEFTEFPYISESNNNDSGISDILTRRLSNGSKLWARCACIGSNGSTLALYFGIHEYEG